MPLKIRLRPEEVLHVDGKGEIVNATGRKIDLVVKGNLKAERGKRLAVHIAKTD